MDAGNQLARIHIGKKALGMDDFTYRGFLEKHTGKRSAKDLSVAQRAWIINEMRKLGAFKQATAALTRQQKACVAKWYDLRRIGAVKSKDKSSLNRFIKKHLGRWSVSDLDDKQTDKLFVMLKNWLEEAEEKQRRQHE